MGFRDLEESGPDYRDLKTLKIFGSRDLGFQDLISRFDFEIWIHEFWNKLRTGIHF